MNKPSPTMIGRAEEVAFPELNISGVPARVDTGAKTSSVWVSGIKEEDGVLRFRLFGKSSPFYTGQVIKTRQFSTRIVSSSMGTVQERYVVKLLVSLGGRNVRASFTLANRSTQAYPVLIGRNVLRGKFIVDVALGKPFVERERARAKELKNLYRK